MKNTLPDALENCLQAMEKGVSIDDALAAFPQWSGELRPLLLLAQAEQARGAARVDPRILSVKRSQLLAKAAEMKTVRRSWWNRPVLQGVLVAIAVLLLMFAGFESVLASAQSSLPGEPLYGLKREVEDLQLQCISDPEKRAAMEMEMNTRRVEETDRLLKQYREEDVSFYGVLEQQSGGNWVVSGIPVVINEDTQVEGVLKPGITVDIWGSTQSDGTVDADRVQVPPGDEWKDDESDEDGEESDSPEEESPVSEDEPEDDSDTKSDD